ncbi:MAG TPA: hypothetical protein EYN64_03690 [Flavobacteriales bacterium]|nr:hypothetical protein [Flavobacteriales bacterium]
MGLFDNTIVSERHQRPSFNGRTILRANFMRDGGYVDLDNYSVSSVMLFRKQANTSPSSILEATTGLVTDAAAATAIWRWTLSGWENYRAEDSLPFPIFLAEGDYDTTIGPSTSGIFEVSPGRLAVVLDGTLNGSSMLRDGTTVGAAANLSGEPGGQYIDVWTVKLCAGCEWVTFINDTQFFQNNAVILTEPLLVTTKERLYNKRIEKGSIEKIKIGTEITIENKNISNSIKNVLREGLITSGAMEIIYHNDDDIHSPAWDTIISFAGTTGLVEITEDNTFIYTFDTTNRTPGTYTAQLKYTILEETILSPLMYFKVI